MFDTTTMSRDEAHSRIFLEAYGRPELLERGYTANAQGISKDGVLVWTNTHGLVNRFTRDTVRTETLTVIPEEVQ